MTNALRQVGPSPQSFIQTINANPDHNYSKTPDVRGQVSHISIAVCFLSVNVILILCCVTTSTVLCQEPDPVSVYPVASVDDG